MWFVDLFVEFFVNFLTFPSFWWEKFPSKLFDFNFPFWRTFHQVGWRDSWCRMKSMKSWGWWFDSIPFYWVCSLIFKFERTSKIFLLLAFAGDSSFNCWAHPSTCSAYRFLLSFHDIETEIHLIELEFGWTWSCTH